MFEGPFSSFFPGSPPCALSLAQVWIRPWCRPGLSPPAMGVKATLPSYELGFYALVVTCAVLYSGSGIFEASRGNAASPGRGKMGVRLLLLQLLVPEADPRL